MENRKDIGRAFRDRLDLIEHTPDAALWNRIEADVNKKRKRRNFLWIFLAISFLSIMSIVVSDSVSDASFFEKLQENASSVENTTEAPDKIINEDYRVSNENQRVGSDNLRPSIENQGVGNEKGIGSENLTVGSSSVDNTGDLSNAGHNHKEETIASRTATTQKTKPGLHKSGDKFVLSGNSASASDEHKTGAKLGTKFSRDNKENPFGKKYKKKGKNKFASSKDEAIAGTDFKNEQEKKKNSGVKNSKASARSEAEINEQTLGAVNATIIDSTNIADQLSSTPDNLAALASETKKDSLNQMLKDKKELKKEEEKEEKTAEKKNQSNLIASAFYGPTTSGALSVKSLINSSFNSYSKEKTITSSYGISLGIKPEKLGIRIGLTKIDLEHSLSIKNNQEHLIADYTNIALEAGTTPQKINDHFSDADNVTLTQKASYLEVPVEVMYTVFSKNKFGADALLGVGITVLNKNNISLSADNAGEMSIGKIDNLTKLNFASHLGIGLNYKLTKKLQLDINPVFKYFHNVGNEYYKPYTFSLQTGLSYRF